MPVVTKYICDGCGAEKGETNHWLVTWRNEVGISLVVWKKLNGQGSGFIQELHCGERCASKAISQWMQERKDQQQ